MKNTATGLDRIIKAFGYTCDGLKAAFREDVAFRQEVYLFAVMLPLAIWLAPNHLSLILMIGSMLIVLMAELANSGIEAAIDRIGPEFHPLSKKAKDVGSALVFVAFVNLAVIWLLVLV